MKRLIGIDTEARLEAFLQDTIRPKVKSTSEQVYIIDRDEDKDKGMPAGLLSTESVAQLSEHDSHMKVYTEIQHLATFGKITLLAEYVAIPKNLDCYQEYVERAIDIGIRLIEFVRHLLKIGFKHKRQRYKCHHFVRHYDSGGRDEIQLIANTDTIYIAFDNDWYKFYVDELMGGGVETTRGMVKAIPQSFENVNYGVIVDGEQLLECFLEHMVGTA
ncbi:MAG: hypothetical protein FWD49_03990 [Firmicutes bacterium]|nr:hypothetical protein [Bacillota bacterium]